MGVMKHSLHISTRVAQTRMFVRPCARQGKNTRCGLTSRFISSFSAKIRLKYSCWDLTYGKAHVPCLCHSCAQNPYPPCEKLGQSSFIFGRRSSIAFASKRSASSQYSGQPPAEYCGQRPWIVKSSLLKSKWSHSYAIPHPEEKNRIAMCLTWTPCLELTSEVVCNNALYRIRLDPTACNHKVKSAHHDRPPGWGERKPEGILSVPFDRLLGHTG